jgi:energy-coupling factor transporter ATP-binding protein EcfA2
MENRLELFREQIAAFDGAADPMRAIEKGYVIEEPDQSSTNALFKRISLRPQSKNLLVGGIGSGKTTQLLRLQQLFQKAPDTDIHPHYVDVTEYTQPDDVQSGTLDAIIGLELIKLFDSNALQVDGNRRAAIQAFAYGSTAQKVISSIVDHLRSPVDLRPVQTLKLSGVLPSRHRSSDLSSQLAPILASLIDDFYDEFQKTPYFLFDGLDRVDKIEKFIQVASSDVQASEVGFVIVGAANLLYSNFIDSISTTFNHIEYRSAFDTTRDGGAYTFFEHVLLARSSQQLFQADALRELIHLSGGVLRDLVNLAQESIQEAYLADAERVNQEHVKQAAYSLGRAKVLGLSQDQYNILKSFNTNPLDIPTSPEEIYLLSSGRILEYRFPDRRFDLHPVLKQLIGQGERVASV